MKIFTVSEIIAAEKAADAAGVSYAQMMETAGRAVAEAITSRQEVAAQRVLVLVGPGNNGGDGLVAGRYLAHAGAEVTFYLYKSRDATQDENFAQVQQMNLAVVEASSDPHFRLAQTCVRNSTILIDALLGTGVTRPIGGDLAELLRSLHGAVAEMREQAQVNARSPLTSIAQLPSQSGASPAPFITAVDCPSGLNCDSGALDPLALAAQLTVTFAGPKRGHFRFPGTAACGELVVADIDIDPQLPVVAAVPLALATAVTARRLLPRRPADGHKGTFGTALIAAGSAHYFGAPLLAARGAYRVGAGLVALAVPQQIRATIAGQLPEATYPPIPAKDILDAASARFLAETAVAAKAKALLVGPGIDQAEAFMAALLALKRLPALIIDADGLNLLASSPDWPQQLPANTILTPHPGEMARLMKVSLAEVQAADRVELARAKAQEWGHIVLLKGAYTVVAARDGRCTLLPFANPALAVGGSGDVLSGIIVGLLAQGLSPYAAAVLGSYMHGAAAQLAVAATTDAGLLASEFADWVPQVRKRIKTFTLTP